MSPMPKRIRRMHSHSVHTMAKKPQIRPNGFVLFDVLYEDGTQTSNRKVPASELGGLDGDQPAPTLSRRRTAKQTVRAHQVDQPLMQDDKMRAETALDYD